MAILHLYPPDYVGLIRIQSQGSASAYDGANVLQSRNSFKKACLSLGFDP